MKDIANSPVVIFLLSLVVLWTRRCLATLFANGCDRCMKRSGTTSELSKLLL